MDSHFALMAVGVDDCAPMNSELCVVDSFLAFEDVGNSSSTVEFSVSFIVAVLNCDQSQVLSLSGLSSSETGENTVLVQSYWLCLVVDFLSFSHSSLFVIMIIQYMFILFKPK